MIYQREEFIQEDAANEKYPVKQIDRLTDIASKDVRYLGHLSMHMQTPMGATSLPISFEIQAQGVKEAFSKFDGQADIAVEDAKKRLQEELQEMRRKAQSRIVTPGEVGGMGGMDLGKIKM